MKLALGIILLVILLVGAVGFAAFCFASLRSEKRVAGGKLLESEYGDEIRAGQQWFRQQQGERINLRARDGVKLAAIYVKHPEAKGTIILMHGYRMDGYTDFSCVYEYYYNMGYSLLNVFQRAHGLSGGKYITFGIKERVDCLDWCNYISDRFGPEHNIILDGLSMGAATVLMAAGLPLPKNVRGIIADCGFTSPLEQFEHVLKKMWHLPLHPIMDLADIFARLLDGFSYKDASALEAMEKCRIPVLFIHGEDDELVPMEHSVRAFRACAAPKRLVTVPRAGHGMSYLTDRAACQRELEVFLNLCSRAGDE